MEQAFLPYGRQSIDEDDIAAVVEVLRSDFLTTGPAVDRFEAEFARATGAPHAVSCSSATAGLHIAAMAAGLGPGDRAVVPTVTFLATANAVRYVGAEVVFADADPVTGLMRPDHLREALRRADGPVKAVFPVHLAGQSEDMAAIRAIANEAGALVVEDASHAVGGRHADTGTPVGSCPHSDMAVFSFHPVKTMAMGEGGAVTTRDAGLAERLARFRSHGMVRDPARFTSRDLAFAPDGTPQPWYYEMPEPGFNYRASDVHCALGLAQLRKLDGFVASRSALRQHYVERIAGLSPHVRVADALRHTATAWHLCVLIVDFAALGIDRATLMNRLRARRIGTQVHYIPVHLQPYYRRRYGALDLPGSLAYYEGCLSVPLYASMIREDVDRVVDALRDCLAET